MSARTVTAPTENSSRGSERSRDVIDARVVAVIDDRRVRVKTAAGRSIECRCARGVDIAWLREALTFGPVDAEVSIARDDGRGSVYAVFPGPEHAAAAPREVVLSAGETLHIVCGRSSVKLTKDGKVLLRGRDVTSRGLRVNRIQGSTVKVN